MPEALDQLDELLASLGSGTETNDAAKPSNQKGVADGKGNTRAPRPGSASDPAAAVVQQFASGRWSDVTHDGKTAFSQGKMQCAGSSSRVVGEKL